MYFYCTVLRISYLKYLFKAMKKSLLIIASLFSVLVMQGQCLPTQNKVLVLGDSWAAFCWQFGSHNTNFDKYGLSDCKAYSTGSSISSTGATDLSQSGSEARDYLTPLKRTAIQSAFAANPDFEIVHLSLGGNDFLGDWDTTWTQTQIDNHTLVVLDSITSIINFLRTIKPGIKIFLSGYDFANFAESINGNTSHPFYSGWNSMLKPRFFQLNTLLVNVNSKFEAYAQLGNNLHFVNNMGLMQYVYGQTTPLLVAPGGTYAPKSVTFPGGNLNYPSPLVSLNTYFIFKDAFHLNSDGFKYFIDNQVKNFYFKALRNYDLTTRNDLLKCGYVTQNLNFSDSSIIVGNSNGIKSIGLLSFKLPVFAPQKAAQGVSVFLKRKNIQNGGPVNYSLTLEIKKGSFGNTAVPDIGDYLASADFTTSVCQFGSLVQNDYWLRLDIPNSICQQLQSNETYQIKMYYNDNLLSNQNVEFYASADSLNSPFLDIKYNSILGVNEIDESIKNKAVLFPNPLINQLLNINFSNKFEGNIVVYNSLGSKVHELSILNAQNTVELNLPFLESGIYFVIAKDKSGIMHREKLIIQN